MSGAVRAFPLAQRVTVPHSHWDGGLAVDLFAPCGTAWVAMFDGVATAADWPLGGHTVLLEGDGVSAYYAHGRADGRASGRVRAGDVLGYVSNTGNANKRGDGQEHGDECHLHLAIGAIDENGGGSIAPWEVLADAPVTTAPRAADGGAEVAGSTGGLPWGWLAAAAAVAWALDLV